MEIKPGTQPGTEIRLRGRGVPHLRRQSVRGDLHVIANVVVPTKLSKRQRELLEAYAKEAGETVSGPAACARSWACERDRRPGRGPAPVAGPLAGHRPRGRGRHARAPGWSSRSPPTTRRSRPCREILARAAPGGTSVEPAFELVEEGLAARVDLARPAMVRAHLPILDPAAVARRRRPGGA